MYIPQLHHLTRNCNKNTYTVQFSTYKTSRQNQITHSQEEKWINHTKQSNGLKECRPKMVDDKVWWIAGVNKRQIVSKSDNVEYGMRPMGVNATITLLWSIASHGWCTITFFIETDELFRGRADSGLRGGFRVRGRRYVFSAHCSRLIVVITGRDIYGFKSGALHFNRG